jgi:hypothetical protein
MKGRNDHQPPRSCKVTTNSRSFDTYYTMTHDIPTDQLLVRDAAGCVGKPGAFVFYSQYTSSSSTELTFRADSAFLAVLFAIFWYTIRTSWRHRRALHEEKAQKLNGWADT